MTILHIFKENDNVQCNELSRLRDGSHYIGRDTPINCKDKRISRKHAVIIVHRNGAVIKSAHINPTFFKSSIGDVIQILKENDMLVLNNGDRFALLEDADWFKVKITYEDYDCNDPNNAPLNSINNKRTSEEDYPEINKRIKVEPQNTPEADRSSTNIDALSNNILSDSVEITTDDINRSQLDAMFCDNNQITENSNLDKLNINTDRPDLDGTLLENTNINVNDIEPDPDHSNVNISTGRLELNNTLSSNPIIDTDRPDLDDTLPENSNININEGEHDSSNINIDRPDLDTTLSVNSNKTLEIQPQQSTNRSTSSLPNIKTEPPDNIKSEPIDETSFNAGIIASSSPGNTPQVKIEPEVKEEPPENNSNAPSSSTNNNPLGDPHLRRDRCWYGIGCYRKNPVHKQDFSHPGDTDYDSDPNDSRPVCPFGVNCYRRNILHRRQFRHFGRPAPRPPNINFNLHINCPCCNNPQDPPRKPGYESDHEPDADY